MMEIVLLGINRHFYNADDFLGKDKICILNYHLMLEETRYLI